MHRGTQARTGTRAPLSRVPARLRPTRIPRPRTQAYPRLPCTAPPSQRALVARLRPASAGMPTVGRACRKALGPLEPEVSVPTALRTVGMCKRALVARALGSLRRAKAQIPGLAFLRARTARPKQRTAYTGSESGFATSFSNSLARWPNMMESGCSKTRRRNNPRFRHQPLRAELRSTSRLSP